MSLLLGKAAWQPNIDGYRYDVAKRYIQGAVTGPDFTRFFDGKIGGTFPMAVLNEELKASIGSKSQVVSLSDETLAKNKENHPEIDLSGYQGLPDIIEKAQLIVQDGNNTFVFMRIGDNLYYGAIKSTRSGETNFLTSLRLARESDIESIRKKGKVIKDEL